MAALWSVNTNKGKRGSRGTSKDADPKVHQRDEGGLHEGGSNGCIEMNSFRIHFGGPAEKLGQKGSHKSRILKAAEAFRGGSLF